MIGPDIPRVQSDLVDMVDGNDMHPADVVRIGHVLQVAGQKATLSGIMPIAWSAGQLIGRSVDTKEPFTFDFRNLNWQSDRIADMEDR